MTHSHTPSRPRATPSSDSMCCAQASQQIPPSTPSSSLPCSYPPFSQAAILEGDDTLKQLAACSHLQDFTITLRVTHHGPEDAPTLLQSGLPALAAGCKQLRTLSVTARLACGMRFVPCTAPWVVGELSALPHLEEVRNLTRVCGSRAAVSQMFWRTLVQVKRTLTAPASTHVFVCVCSAAVFKGP